MKRCLQSGFLAAVALCLGGALSTASAQTATFTYNDGNGVPNAGTYQPGDSFTFAINLAYTPGGNVTNLAGLSYWLQQESPAGSPFNFSITARDVTGSQFTFLQSPGAVFPQAMNPSNSSDLGGGTQSGNGVGAGNYFIADITVYISPSAPSSGTYILSDTLTGGKTSVITDMVGHTFSIPEADYTITMVPEPATWAGGALTVATLLIAGVRGQALRSLQRWPGAKT
jgi:hypothetical protein